MDNQELKYFDYNDIGEILGCSMSKVNKVLFSYDILTQGNDRNDLTLFRVNIISPRFIMENRDLYKKFFRESFVKPKNGGRVKYKLEVTEEFLGYLLALFDSFEKFEQEEAERQEKIKAENLALREKVMKAYEEKKSGKKVDD